MEDKSSDNQKGTKWLNRNGAAMGFASLFSHARNETRARALLGDSAIKLFPAD
jgi:hypothetical protein